MTSAAEGNTMDHAAAIQTAQANLLALRALSDVFQHELDRDLPAPAADCDDATFTAWNDALEQAIEDRGGPALFAARRAAEAALLDAVATWIRSLRTPSAALRNMLDMAPTRPDVQLKLLALAMRLDTNTLAMVA